MKRNVTEIHCDGTDCDCRIVDVDEGRAVELALAAGWTPYDGDLWFCRACLCDAPLTVWPDDVLVFSAVEAESP